MSVANAAQHYLHFSNTLIIKVLKLLTVSNDYYFVGKKILSFT